MIEIPVLCQGILPLISQPQVVQTLRKLLPSSGTVQYPREKMGFRENGSFLANGTTFLTFYTSSKLEKWVFQKMGRLDDREENGTLANLRESNNCFVFEYY